MNFPQNPSSTRKDRNCNCGTVLKVCQVTAFSIEQQQRQYLRMKQKESGVEGDGKIKLLLYKCPSASRSEEMWVSTLKPLIMVPADLLGDPLFRYMDARTLGVASQVCTRWRTLSEVRKEGRGILYYMHASML